MPPAIALIGAVGSVAGGMAAVGGTMAGFAAAGIGTQLVAGAMIAGGVMTGLGAVTGNKRLQKWGGILSIAGGIGGLATGAWASTASSVAESAARESFSALDLATSDIGIGGASAGAGGIGEAAGGLLQANAGALDFGALNGATGPAGGVTATPMTPGIAGPAVPGPSIPQSVNLVNAGGTMQTAAKAAESGGMLSSITDKVKPAFEWMEKNPRITQAGAGLLQSGLSGYAQQQALQDQMRMQDEAQARARKRLSDSVQGVSVPVYQRKGP